MRFFLVKCVLLCKFDEQQDLEGRKHIMNHDEDLLRRDLRLPKSKTTREQAGSRGYTQGKPLQLARLESASLLGLGA